MGFNRAQLDNMSEEELKMYILRLQSRSVTPLMPSERRKQSSNVESDEDVEGSSSLDNGGSESEAGEVEGDGVNQGSDGEEGDGKEELEAEDLEKLITVRIVGT